MEATIYADRELTMTVEDFINANAFCGRSRRRIKELFAGREALSAIDVLELDIPDAHKLWAVLREELIPLQTLHKLAVEFARTALLKEREAGREPDERSWRALDVKLAWLDGKASDEELEAAIADAASAADDAANAAGTTWDAYWAAKAAATAAWTVPVAAYCSVWAATMDVTKAEAEQVALVKRMLGVV